MNAPEEHEREKENEFRGRRYDQPETLFRIIALLLIGLSFVAFLGWLTNAAFAIFCYGALLTMVAIRWLSLPFAVDNLAGALFGLVSPFVIGIIWFHWWWGLAGVGLGGFGASLSEGCFMVFSEMLGSTRSQGHRVAMLLGIMLALGGAIALVL